MDRGTGTLRPEDHANPIPRNSSTSSNLRHIAIVSLTGVLLTQVQHPSAAQPSPKTQALLERAATYLDQYTKTFAGVVSEERYEQTVHGSKLAMLGHRVLRSDVLLVSSGRAGWLCYRDVFEVDGKIVRDRSDRLMELFQHPSPDGIEQAEKIRQEGARFNIGGITRTINDPTMALPFLERNNHLRSEFEVGGSETVSKVRADILRFQERFAPRMIKTADESAASGRFWIEPQSGRIIRTELVVSSEDTRGTVTVDYGPQEKLGGLWVPVRMTEKYAINTTRTIDCVATYTNFRRFDVIVGIPARP